MNAPVTLKAVPVEGKPFTGNIASLRITHSFSSPAGSMSAALPCSHSPGELRGAEIHHAGRLLFSGEMDEQALSLSGSGNLLSLEARTRGALLLDNEAIPRTYQNLSLQALFGICAAPYGFTLRCPLKTIVMGEFTVGKGMSEWEALRSFSLRCYGISPFLQGNDTVVVDRPAFGNTFTLTNSGTGVRFLMLEYRNNRCAPISRILFRDETGRYESALYHPAVERLGIVRKRYVIPADEFLDQYRMDAVQRIHRSLWENEEILALAPGFLDIRPGQGARVRHQGMTFEGFYLEEATYSADKGGVFTKLSLRRSAHFI